MADFLAIRWTYDDLLRQIVKFQEIIEMPIYPEDLYHTTLVHSKKDSCPELRKTPLCYFLTQCELTAFKSKVLGDVLVLKFENEFIRMRRYSLAKECGVSSNYYQPHISLCYHWNKPSNFQPIKVNNILLHSSEEYSEKLDTEKYRYALDRYHR